MDYTITPQYHDKKGCYIYVVRLSDRVDREHFSTLSDLAKSHKGYYSSFRGVNGFVFKTEEQAEEFCDDMMAILEASQDPSVSPVSKNNVEPLTPEDIPTHGMELHEALHTIIQTMGDSIIIEPRLVNILDDYKSYSDIPTAKYILRAIIADGYAQKLLLLETWNNEAINLSSRFTATTGFMPDTVEILFKSIAYGLGWIKKWEHSKTSSTTTPVPRPLTRTKAVGTRSNGWTKKMDEDQTDDFFQALTEYDKSLENKLQVKLENLYYTVEDSNLCFSLEISHSFKDNKYVYLRYAIYNIKGKIIFNNLASYINKQSVNPKPCVEYTYKKASNIGKIKFYWE